MAVQLKATVIICASLLLAIVGRAQQPNNASQDDNVIRINTELVQTDINVVDKKGHFVEGARPEDFELTLDGKAQKILFFDRVVRGSRREAQLASKLSQPSPSITTTALPDDATDRGRTIFFFVDDLHLSAEGISRSRKALLDFVDHQMHQNDQIAIVSASGQIGFLQQVTDNPIVLRTAIERIKSKPALEPQLGKTRISEYMANQIANHNDRALFAYLMESVKLEQQMGAGNRQGDHRTSSSYSAQPYLENRIRQIQSQSKFATKATLESLHGLLSSSASLAGRKVLFVVSDGFLVNQQDTDVVSLMRSLTEAAAQTSTVIYPIDLRDMASISSIDVSTNDEIEFSSRTSGLALSEKTANREPLQTMSDETGGRVLLNPNSIVEGVTQALDETADYYLLAWRPDSTSQREGKEKLNVVLKNHADWRVRVRRKFYASAAASPADKKDITNSELAKAAGLQAALGSLYPRKQAPINVSAGYVYSNAANSLRISMQINPRLFASQVETKGKAELDVIGAAVDDRGIISTFKQVLTITNQALASNGQVIWHQQLRVPAGLYQVRVAVRERESGLTGSAQQWLVIPEARNKELTMSSLFIARRDESTNTNGTQSLKVSVDRQFKNSSVLRFQTYVYNGTVNPGADSAEVVIAARILRNGEPVLIVKPVNVPNTSQSSQDGLPYWSEIALDKLTPGRYQLVVSAVDRHTNVTTSQQIDFTVTSAGSAAEGQW